MHVTSKVTGEGHSAKLESGKRLTPLLRCTELFRIRTGSQRNESPVSEFAL
ncbi:hypothetical protein RESH_03046 [Rhodopirellula europaea SH398]|uniref:Uncharacterized protein n=1 Tax=Rhodopirellula europaea SH398 TaxID=1263868 RepID=M5S452_9BACT|nr:hypothetical protein RESH_03046 [Rhodopirellula europaea SH398]